MNWIEAALIGAVLLGLACGAALVVRNPAFWIDMGLEIWRRLLPVILNSSPETQARAHEDARQAIDRTVTGRERER